MKRVTEQQARVLAFITSEISAQGMPPTMAEIAAHFGWSSPNAAQRHVDALAFKGKLQRLKGKARGIKLVDTTTAPRGTTARGTFNPVHKAAHAS